MFKLPKGRLKINGMDVRDVREALGLDVRHSRSAIVVGKACAARRNSRDPFIGSVGREHCNYCYMPRSEHAIEVTP